MPTSSARLVEQARRFASDLSDLLNATITNGTRISSVLHSEGTCWVAKGITRTNLTLGEGVVPLRIGRRATRGYVLIAQILQLDPEAEHLTTVKSQYGLYLDEGLDQMVIHYDYERKPDHPYPWAHVQVAGESPHLSEFCRRAGGPRS